MIFVVALLICSCTKGL